MGKKKRPGEEGERVYFLRGRRTEDEAPRAASYTQFRFASCVHEGSIGEGTTLSGKGDRGSVRERERKTEGGIGAIDSW